MIFSRVFFSICTVSILLCLTACNGRKNPEAVRDDFAQFSRAVVHKDGAEAAQYVSRSSLELYEKCRQAALWAPQEALDHFSQYEVVLIAQFRWLLTPAELSSMDGAGLFAWGVMTGAVETQDLFCLQLGDAVISGSAASAPVIYEGRARGTILFSFEKGRWCLDLKTMLQDNEPLYAQMREQTGKSKAELAVSLLQAAYEEIPDTLLKSPEIRGVLQGQ